MLKNLLTLAMVSAFVGLLAACNRVRGAADGAERDIQATGENIDNATD